MSYPVSINSSTSKRKAGLEGAGKSLMRQIVRCLFAGSLASCLLLPAIAAQAAVTMRDLQIVARTLGFLDPPLTGEVNVGIVFDPGNARSREEAGNISRLMGNGLQVGNLVLKPVVVPLADAANADVRFFLLAEALGDSADDLQSVIQQRQLPCLTADLEQVRSGNCAVGIQSSPKVEILVNLKEASASSVNFASVFRMMITEF